MSFPLSDVARLAVKYVNTTQRNIFLTGKAGSGKTTLLKYLIENTYKNAVVAAPTGIAAINAGGVTLHSLLQLPFGTFIPENITFQNYEFQDKVNTPQSVVAQLQMGANKRNLLKEIELLIIDEVSMLRADLLDCIDHVLRHIRRKKHLPFGGVQLLFIGDLNQLPPVVRNMEWPLLSKYYSSAYFFESHALKAAPPVFIELDKIYRQSDPEFIDILNRLRDNCLLSLDIQTLNTHFRKNFSPASDEGYIHITTHNRKSDVINKKELDKLKTTSYNFEAKISGDFPEHMYPLPEILSFKEGAQVMFIKNDSSGEGKYYNGRIGRIISLSNDKIDVKLNDTNDIVHVSTYVWENKRYKLNATTNEIEESVTGSFEQYPLKLAWAITVHKSQGLTFEKAILDLTDSFAPGQMYVALSRLTSLQGLVLSTPIPETGIEIDQALAEFAKTKKELDSLSEELTEDRKVFLINYISNAFSFGDLLKELSYHIKSFDKDENRSIKQQYLSWTQELFRQTRDLEEVAEKFCRQISRLATTETDNYINLLNERVSKAEGYFIPLIQELLNKIKVHKKEVGAKPLVKTYSKELKVLLSLYSKPEYKIRKAALLIKHIAENKIPDKKELYKSLAENNKESKFDEAKKSPTREVTLALYRQGLNIEDIAKQRGLSHTTIEGHLSDHIATGQLKATDFLQEEKINQILTVAKQLDTTLLNQIKEKLGDEFTYGDIKFAMAHQKSLSET